MFTQGLSTSSCNNFRLPELLSDENVNYFPNSNSQRYQELIEIDQQQRNINKKLAKIRSHFSTTTEKYKKEIEKLGIPIGPGKINNYSIFQLQNVLQHQQAKNKAFRTKLNELQNLEKLWIIRELEIQNVSFYEEYNRKLENLTLSKNDFNAISHDLSLIQTAFKNIHNYQDEISKMMESISESENLFFQIKEKYIQDQCQKMIDEAIAGRMTIEEIKAFIINQTHKLNDKICSEQIVERTYQMAEADQMEKLLKTKKEILSALLKHTQK